MLVRHMVERLRDLESCAISHRMRSRRWERLLALHPDLPQMTVVDLGGTERSWAQAPARPARLVLVNLPDHDACDPLLLAGARFDLANVLTLFTPTRHRTPRR